MSLIVWIILAIVLLVVVWFIAIYNRFVSLKLRVSEALSDIDVQLKRRYDLIPNLVETVKGYMTHERELLENVTQARAAAVTPQKEGDLKEQQQKENMLSNTLRTLFAVAENYPDLKANVNFLDLQRELADTENKIQAARRFYNGTVRDLNTTIETVPTNLVAGAFGFKSEPFFQAEEGERGPVHVKF